MIISNYTDKAVINQSLHPLVNSSLLKSPHLYPPYLNPYNLATFYDIVHNAAQMNQAVDTIVQRSNTTKMRELTVLERSATQRQNTNAAGSTSMQLFSFLSAIAHAVRAWSEKSTLVLNEVGAYIQAFFF